MEYLLANGARCEANTFDGERCVYGALDDVIRQILLNYKVVTSHTMRRNLYDEFLRRLVFVLPVFVPFCFPSCNFCTFDPILKFCFAGCWRESIVMLPLLCMEPSSMYINVSYQQGAVTFVINLKGVGRTEKLLTQVMSL